MAESITGEPLRILSLEDSRRDFELLESRLQDAGFPMALRRVDTEAAYVEALRGGAVDIILADFHLPAFDAFAALLLAQEICPEVPFICVSGTVGEEVAISLIQHGAVDYVVKDNLTRLPHAVRRAIDLLEQTKSRKRAEEALLASEQRYRAIIQTSMDGFWHLSKEGRILQVNEAYMRMSGYTENELLSMHVSDVEAVETNSVVEEHLRQVMQKGEHRFESFHRRKDGSLYPLEITVQFKDEEGGYLVAFLRDITERKQTMQALRDSEARFRTMFEKHTAVMFLIDPDSGAILDANNAASKFYGYDIPTLLRMNISEINTLSSEDVAEERLHALREERNYFVFPHRLADQSLRIVEVHSSPVTVNNRSVLFSIIHDITKRTQAENELVTAKLRAEKSERLKDVFIANISHEIRTPLNIILGYTGVIADKFLPDAPENAKRYFESVERGGERLMRTVDMILNVSRLQAGEFTLKSVPLDIPKLVMKIAADHQALAQQKNLSLSAVDECGSATVQGDEYCVVQAVSNIVHNAIKFTMRGGVDLKVYFDASRRVCISCTDTGIGIAPDYLPLLFSRYSQEQTGYTRPFEGLGLGMALVKEYLALNGATIDVQSIKGEGSTFIITFDTPVGEERVGNAASGAEMQPILPASTGTKARPAVLLIEDDEMTLEYMDVVLASRYDIFTARSGPEAWDVLRVTPVDIVLMDISLAGKQTGIELTQEIRRSPAHRCLPIIAVTAHAYERDRENCLDAGCDDFIRKPINSAILLERMEQLLRR